MRSRILFRADGNLEIGFGHFVRTLGLAELVHKDFECVFCIKNPSTYQLEEISKFCSLVILSEDEEAHYPEFLGKIEANDVVLIDDYNFSSSWQNEIKKKGAKVIYIDDHNDKYYVCDILINNIPGFPEESFKKEPYTKLCLGIDYALIRQQFFNPELRVAEKQKGTVFISFGGADFYNLSEKYIGYLNQVYPDCQINLLIGDAYKYMETLEKYKNITIHRNISADKVASLMAISELCIIPASSLLNEAACIGSKIMLGYFADNQKRPYQYFIDNDLAIGIGDYRTAQLNDFSDKLKQVQASTGMITHQRRHYHYQQYDNLKTVFYEAARN